MQESENIKARLEKEIIEKDDHVRKLAIELAANDITETDTQNPALLATIESLETIINQKEDTINRLQELLKECREDHTKEIIELQKKAEAQHFDNKEKYVYLYNIQNTNVDNFIEPQIILSIISVLFLKYNNHSSPYFVSLIYIPILCYLQCFSTYMTYILLMQSIVSHLHFYFIIFNPNKSYANNNIFKFVYYALLFLYVISELFL